ncbi:MAG: thioredoxin domain-containing protein [Gemmatimonadetes bacterium]|nr:thioredoxin domain-containing protein [Gemmatimonadota bacterium]
MSGLSASKSPFLRHGAEQPVAWLPWGDAAFERARAEGRPVLLDIGAVWCHWCHVMDRESYEDPETAALINELYVPVKVDRDERPDVDARYQRAVQAISGQGGWPLTAFLTPAGEVFHGGTYFPPEDAHGRPSFRRVLREVARVWTEERERAERAAGAVGERLAETLTAEAAPGDLDPSLLDHAVEALAEAFDFRHGGFGRAPKFPNPGGLELMLETWRESEETDWARRVVEESLLAMARGGLRDHLGGGFHRYATDARWLIPHFEKMAADNGPLLALCARAAVALESAELADAAAGVVAYYRDVATDLVDAGGFPASQDADIGFDDDGDHWTWTEAEVRAALDDDTAEAAILYWGLRDTASAMHLDPRRHVLYRALSVEDVARRMERDPDAVRAALERARETLKRVRDERPRPYVDETLYAGWVGLVASGHVAAARHIELRDAGRAARAAMERVWSEGWEEGRGLVHRLGDPASGVFLGDQAYCAEACLDLHEYTGDERWLDRAGRIAAVMRERFPHESGALRDLPADADTSVPVLGQPRLDITDSPEPAANAVAALVLARLGALLEDDGARRASRDILRAFAGSAPRFAPNAATYFRALRWAVRPVTTVVVIEAGPDRADAPAPGSLRAAALATYRPTTVVRCFQPGAVDADRLPEAVREMLSGEAPRAYVCAGRTCAAPVSRPAELIALLRDFRG